MTEQTTDWKAELQVANASIDVCLLLRDRYENGFIENMEDVFGFVDEQLVKHREQRKRAFIKLGYLKEVDFQFQIANEKDRY